MVARLVAEEGPLRGLFFEFSEGENWLIGSDADEVDFFLNDTTVSRKQLLCRKTDKGITIKNIGRANPSTVNGEEFSDVYLLQEQDRVKIGQNIFVYSAEEEEGSEEKTAYDTIFEEGEELPLHLTSEASLILKVISGPNAGAEIGIQKDHSYVIGKDASSCDIVLQDLSVSRNHARLSVDKEGQAEIEDMGSKNGTLVNGTPIDQKKKITSQDLIALGTTTFLLIDREIESETIYAPRGEKYEPPIPTSKEEEKKEEEPVIPWKKRPIPTKHLTLAGSFLVLFFILFMSFFSLFKSETMLTSPKKEEEKIEEIVKKFPKVQFTFNSSGGKLFLAGHLLTPIDRQELLYFLEQLTYITSIDDHIIIDEYVSKTTNDVLVENGGFRGVSVHAPEAGKFVVTGYLQTKEQLQALDDFFMSNFPYLDKLTNQVVLESTLFTQVINLLASKGFGGITTDLINGDLLLAGRYNDKMSSEYERLIKEFQSLQGIRTVKNIAIPSSAEASMVDLTSNYQVSGYALHEQENYSVIVNGKILLAGQYLDGMEVTQIQRMRILLEKEGVKYKIDYAQ